MMTVMSSALSPSSLTSPSWWSLQSNVLLAHLTSGYTRPQVSGFEGLRYGCTELVVALNRGQPEAELVGKVVTRAARSVTLDEGRGSEVLKAGSRGGQGLTTTLGTGSCVHDKAVTYPQWVPSPRALWYG